MQLSRLTDIAETIELILFKLIKMIEMPLWTKLNFIENILTNIIKSIQIFMSRKYLI